MGLLQTLAADAERIADVEFPDASAIPGLVTALAGRLEVAVPEVLSAVDPPKPASGEPAPSESAGTAEAAGAPSEHSSIASDPAPAEPAAEATVEPNPPATPPAGETDAERADRLEAELERVQAAMAPPAHEPGTVST